MHHPQPPSKRLPAACTRARASSLTSTNIQPCVSQLRNQSHRSKLFLFLFEDIICPLTMTQSRSPVQARLHYFGQPLGPGAIFVTILIVFLDAGLLLEHHNTMVPCNGEAVMTRLMVRRPCQAHRCEREVPQVDVKLEASAPLLVACGGTLVLQ